MVDMVAGMKVDMVADMTVDMVADMKVYKVAGMVPDIKVEMVADMKVGMVPDIMVDMVKKYTLLRDCSYFVICSILIFSEAVKFARPHLFLPFEGVLSPKVFAHLMLEQACLVRDVG